MNVLSLFDGMSMGRIALEKENIEINKYYASEIDKYAEQASKNNYNDIIRLGDVKNWESWNLPKIDLLIGGSPCQGFSSAGKKGGTKAVLNGEEIVLSTLEEYKKLKNEKNIEFLSDSSLFWEYVSILEELKSKNNNTYFLLENVAMSKENENMISKALGVKPIIIDSENFSAQKRKRLYWTNIKVDLNYLKSEETLDDILEKNFDNKYLLSEKANIRATFNKRSRAFKKDQKKSGALLSNQFKQSTDSLYALVKEGEEYNKYRKLTPIECERLQKVPDNYTAGLSDTQRYKMLGNGWTVDVIAHIFKGLKAD